MCQATTSVLCSEQKKHDAKLAVQKTSLLVDAHLSKCLLRLYVKYFGVHSTSSRKCSTELHNMKVAADAVKLLSMHEFPRQTAQTVRSFAVLRLEVDKIEKRTVFKPLLL